MATTIAAINDAIASAMGLVTGVIARSYDEIEEGVADQEVLEVYWQSGQCDVQGTDRSSFGGATRITELTFHCDLYVNERSDIGENMQRLVELADLMWTELEKQKTGKLFGIEGLRAFHWSAERVNFERPAGSELLHVGIRFIITVRIF